MKKLIPLVLISALVVVGAFLFLDRPEPEQPDNNTNNDSTPALTGQDLVDRHLSGAVIRETVDATDRQDVVVTIGDSFFNPTTLTIKKGTTVTWRNEGSMLHDVTSSADSPRSGLSSALLAQGEEYSFTFEDTGTYLYFCTPHPDQMRAVVEVVE